MDPVKVKRSMRIAAIALILSIGNFTMLHDENIRAVTAITLVTIGMAAGVLLVNFFMYRKIKSSGSIN